MTDRPPSSGASADVIARLASLAGEFSDLARRAAVHVDGLSLDLARDVGAVARSGEAFYGAARAQWRGLEIRTVDAWAQARAMGKGAPRMGRVLSAGLVLLAAARWHKMRAVAAGIDWLRGRRTRAHRSCEWP
jgi:hypothetical protein